MSPWLYKNKKISCIEDLPEGVIGYIYKITNIKDNRVYIGKKALFHSRKTKISKKEKTATGTRKTFKRTKKESDWGSYWGSCLPLLSEIKKNGHDHYKREIIEFCYCTKSLSYKEVWWQFKYDVLENDSYNGNILRRFFKGEQCK